MKTAEMYNSVVCLRSRLHWLHCEALCAEPLVLPSLPDQCFLHGMILLSWRPRNWKIKKNDVCMEGVREKERGAPLHVYGVSDSSAWYMCVCTYWYACPPSIDWLSGHVFQLFSFFLFLCHYMRHYVPSLMSLHPLVHLLREDHTLHASTRLLLWHHTGFMGL